jgi:hypothetical protein
MNIEKSLYTDNTKENHSIEKRRRFIKGVGVKTHKKTSMFTLLSK